MDFTGRVAVVTGAASGIGAAIACALAERGARVLALDVKPFSPGLQVHSDRIEARHCDVASESSVRDAFGYCSNKYGRLDFLCSSAGIAGQFAPVQDYDPSVWDQVLTINLRGTFLAMRAALPLMLAQRRGSVVNIASITAERASPSIAAYAASKGGMVALTRVAALENAKTGIRVNAVCPGSVDTTISGVQSDETRSARVAAIPMGRIATPDDVANVALFLFSDASAYITGQCYNVDGGRSAG